ncbi:DUF3857 domain-containing protein [Vogesella sp. LIG4]|uniref:DUF3857 domain-containing protein n=1 Tax=Vogesella sp. LIG4 TaxID=1192162 RepID=UPI00139034C8|nr:DUF3857 domain-containing protein [Vogesella sp. LIG4]
MKYLFAAVVLGSASLASQAALRSPAEAPAAIEHSESCRWDLRSGSDCRVEQSITILREAGRDKNGTQTLWYEPDDKLEVREAYTLQPDGRRINVATRDQQRGNAADDNGFNNYQFLKLAFPEVKVGSKLVLHLRRFSPVIKPFGLLAKRFVFDDDDLRYDRMSYEVSAGQQLFWRVNDPQQKLDAQADQNGRHLRIQLRAPLYLGITEAGDRLKLRNPLQFDVSTVADAREAERPAAQAIARLLAAPLPPLAQQAVRAASGQPWQQQVAQLLEDVNDRIRYMGDWRVSENGVIPFPLADIERRGFGDCKDMALTLTAMLRAVGLDASVAFVRSDWDNRPPLLVTWGYFNHAIVRLKVEGVSYWLDPTSKVNALGSTSILLQDRVAFVLGAEGAVQPETIPANPPPARFEEQVQDFTSLDGKRWRMSGSNVLHGQTVRELFEDELASNRSDADSSLVRDYFLFENMNLRSLKVERGTAQRLVSSPYTVTALATVGNVTRPLGPYRLADLRLLRPRIENLRDYYAQDGVSDYFLEVGGYSGVTRLHGVKPLLQAASCKVQSRWLDYAIAPVAVVDGIGLRYELQRKVNWVSGDELHSEDFRQMLDQLEECDAQAQLLLYR